MIIFNVATEDFKFDTASAQSEAAERYKKGVIKFFNGDIAKAREAFLNNHNAYLAWFSNDKKWPDAESESAYNVWLEAHFDGVTAAYGFRNESIGLVNIECYFSEQND